MLAYGFGANTECGNFLQTPLLLVSSFTAVTEQSEHVSI